MNRYIWQNPDWPDLKRKSEPLLPLIGRARFEQGKLLAQLNSLGFKLIRQAQAQVLVEEAIGTAAIEGERLDWNSVRSSVARRLGLSSAGLPPASRAVDGLVEVLLDATRNHNKPLTAARLKAWQAALFPAGYSGLKRIRTGKWRGLREPMRVVSGSIGHERLHYEVPPGGRVEKEMRQFLSWWKRSMNREEGLLRAGLAHFYLVTIHPFADGNGRIARALTDMALAQDEHLARRYYSLSSQIMVERDDYYRILEKCQKGDEDVTEWLVWFLKCYTRAVEGAGKLIQNVLDKAAFWRHHETTELNERQRKVITRLLDAGREGFIGGMTTRKYASMTKVSRVTAYREITDLLEKRIFRQNLAKGRSVSYNLHWI